MKNFSSKKALLLSVLSMVICVSMLIGSTFAWFTDSATASVNKIQSGNLEIELEMSKDGGNTWETVNDNSRLDFLVNGALPAGDATILWEPGCTFELPLLRVRNSGNLALKYQVVISGATNGNEDGKDGLKLLEVVKFTASVDGAEGTAVNVKDGSAVAKGMLVPAEKADETNKNVQTIKISAHMDETAGNEYKGLVVKGIKINVVATQATYEYDSNSNQYDAGAEMVYPEGITNDSFAENQTSVDSDGNFYTSFESAMAGVADGGTLYFKGGSTIDFPTHLNVTKSITIQGNGADFSGKDISIGTYAAPEKTETTIKIYNAKNLVVWGQPVQGRTDIWNVKFYNCANDGYNFLMYRNDRNESNFSSQINLVIENCKANGFHDSIVHTTADGSIVIKNTAFTNNCAPVNIAHKQSGTMTVSVENCTFVNCGKIDTSNDYFAPVRFVNNSTVGTLNVTLTNNGFSGTIGTNGDILLGDYRTGKASHKVTATIVTSTPVMVKSSEDAAYSYAGGTIVAGLPTVTAGTQEELKNVLGTVTAGQGAKLALSTGEYTLYNVDNNKTQNTSLVIEGTGKDSTVFTAGDMTVSNANGEGSSDYSYENSEVVFKNMTINVGTGNYKGFVRAKSLYFENCKIVGRGSYWGDGEVVFKGCEFEDNAGDYNIWTYSGASFTFDSCTFNSSVGKFVNAYKEQRVDSTLNFINCNFNYTGSGTSSKPAVCLKSYTGIIWNVTFTDCTSNAATDSGTDSNLYSIESGMNAGTTVTINNTVVWENGAKK